MEYQDTTIQATSNGVVKLYNQVFSYWVDNNKYVWTAKAAGVNSAQSDAATFNSDFLGQVASTGATASVWPKPTGATSNQALLIQLVFAETAVCVGSGSNYLGALALTTNCAATASPWTPQIGVLLKVVFNNGILAIPDSSFIYGVQVIGSLFPGATPSTSFLQYSSSLTSTTGPIGNTIIKDTTNNLWHLSISCVPISSASASAADLTCYTATKFVATSPSAATDTFSGLAFINTNIAKYPTMYADAYVLDFIVCLKIAGYSSITVAAATAAPLETATSGAAQWQLVEEGCDTATAGAAPQSCTVSAGPGLINGYVISGMVDTAVKTSIVNGYVTSTPTYGGSDSLTFIPFIPAYLRLGISIASPVTSASLLGFFIGSANAGTEVLYPSLATYATSAGLINIVDTVGTATTAILGQGATYHASLVDQWWAHNCLIMSGTVSSGTAATLNYYIPIQITFASIDSLNVAFLGTQTNGQFPVSAVYRVFGGIVSNSILGATPSYGTVGATLYHSVSQIAVANAAYSTDFVGGGSGTSLTFTNLYWDVGMTASAANGCFGGSQTPSTSPQMAGSILPSKSFSTGFYILSDVPSSGGTSCNIAPGNTGAYSVVNSARASANTWGEAFIVYVRESTNVFSSSTLTWDYSNTNTNKCYFHTIGYSTSNIFTIFCTADAYGSATFGSGSKKINIASFTVPFYWGQNYVIKSKINYAWSSNAGTIASFNGDPATTSTGWTQTGCTASDSLSLAPTSIDVPITITLTSSNGVTYSLAAADYLTLAITSSTTATFYSVCTHSTLGCSILGTTITLTNNNAAALSISDASIAINGWVDTGATGSTTSYSIAVSYKSNGNLIETCSSSASGGFQITGSALVNVVTIGSFGYMANQGARGVWSFSFTYPRIIRIGYDFALNVGALAGPTTGRDVANYRCMILQNGAVSNAWSTLTSISSSTYVSTVTSKTLFASGATFTYKCLGGGSPDGSVAFTNLVTGTLERTSGGTKVTASSISTANQYTVPTPTAAAATLAGVTLTKFFNTRGFESDYVISFVPVAANITASGRIVVEFSQSIPAKLNRYGRVECFLNETPVFCEFPAGNERRLNVWPNMVLYTTQTFAYVLRVAGVTQPNSLGANDADSNKKIFFALSSGSDPYAGITEQTFLTETWDASLTTATISSILIHDFSYQVSKIRSSTSFTYVLNFPANTFTTASSILWVQLPGSVARSIFYGSSPSFTFVRVGDSTSTNLVTTSTVLRGGRVAVVMKVDATNAVSCNYTLTINGLATPQIPPQQGFLRDDFRIFTADTTNTTVLSSTASGSRNTSTYISWNSGSYSAAQLLFWYDPNGNQVNMVDVSIGTYQTLVFLSASMNIFTNTFTFAINGGNSSAFLTAPKDPNYPIRAVLGSTAAPVYIAAKTGTAPGAYYVSWSSSDTTGYSPLQTWIFEL